MTPSRGPAVSPPGTASLETGRLNIITHLLSQIPYRPPTPRDTTLPKRGPAHGYVQPDLPLRYIPAPF
jgi:hypothetical protein